MGDNCMWKHVGGATQAPAPKAKAKAKAKTRARSTPPPQAAAIEGMTKEQADARVAKLRKQKEKLDARLGQAAVAAAGVGAPSKAAARRARSKVRKELGLQGAAVPQNPAVPLDNDTQKEYDAIAMCAIPMGNLPHDFWEALDTLKQVADEVPNMKTDQGPKRRGTSLAGLPPKTLAERHRSKV